MAMTITHHITEWQQSIDSVLLLFTRLELYRVCGFRSHAMYTGILHVVLHDYTRVTIDREYVIIVCNFRTKHRMTRIYEYQHVDILHQSLVWSNVICPVMLCTN